MMKELLSIKFAVSEAQNLSDCVDGKRTAVLKSVLSNRAFNPIGFAK